MPQSVRTEARYNGKSALNAVLMAAYKVSNIHEYQLEFMKVTKEKISLKKKKDTSKFC